MKYLLYQIILLSLQLVVPGDPRQEKYLFTFNKINSSTQITAVNTSHDPMVPTAHVFYRITNDSEKQMSPVGRILLSCFSLIILDQQTLFDTSN